jgi:tetratricopeptide (TPR) repeat protein
MVGVLVLTGCRSAESRMAKKSDWTPPSKDGAGGPMSQELAQNGAENAENPLAGRGLRGAPPPGGTLASRDRNGMPPAGMNGPLDAATGARGGRGDRFDPVAEHLAQGRDELSRGNLEQAKLHFNRVLKDVPNHAEAHHRMAVVADKQQNWPEAELHYRAALRARPNDPNLHSDLGYSYVLQSRYGDAEKELNAALKVDSGHTRALNNLGLLYGRQGDYPRALATFRRVGSEEEAQQKMARMFSDAPPSAMLANGANNPSPNEPPRVAAVGYQAEQKLPSDPAAANAILAGIKSRMEEERRRGEAAREEAQARRRSTSLPTIATPRSLPGLMPEGSDAGMAYRRQPEGMRDEVEIESARQAMAGQYSGMAANGNARPENPAGYGMPAGNGDPYSTPDLGKPVVLSPGSSANFASQRPGQPTLPSVQIPESYAGRERRVPEGAMSAYGTSTPAGGVVNAGGATSDDVWPPKPSRNKASSSIERTGFQSDPRMIQPGAGRSPLAPTQQQLEAQRMATQIGMGAGPGGMFSGVDSRSERGAPNAYNAPGAGPYGNNPGPNVATNFGPGSQPHAAGPEGGAPSYRREWRDDEQAIANDPTMPPTGPSAVTQSYQDHMGGGMSPDNPLYDPEHQAILNDLKRDRQHLMTTPAQWNGGSGEMQSNQYYSPMDASMQPYENMRTEARAAAHAPNGEDPRTGRPTSAGQSFHASGAPNNPASPMGRGQGPMGGANLDGGGYSMGDAGYDRDAGLNGMPPRGMGPAGYDDGANYGAGAPPGYGANPSDPMPRGSRGGVGNPSPQRNNPGNGISPWGSSRGMDTYNTSRGR